MFTFVDICSGIGGFHQVMTRLGGKCVFASEIDKYAVEVYKNNYGIDSLNDITKINPKEIPAHDVLCAGFPCVAFSKAGHRLGFEDERGRIFFNISEILKYHKPRYIVMENVKSLIGHNNGKTWQVIKEVLEEIGYGLTEVPLLCNPIQIGIPQNRERVLILGEYGKDTINIKNDLPKNSCKSIFDGFLLDPPYVEGYALKDIEIKTINIWNEFIQGIKNESLTFPVFYDALKDLTEEDKLEFSEWKRVFLDKNRLLYLENKEFIDSWKKKYNNLDGFHNSHKILEWHVGKAEKDIWKHIIQFRPSGLRVRKIEFFPALISMTDTQIPIIGPYKRRLTVDEARRLQSFPEDFKLLDKKTKSYKQLGNAINVDIVYYFVNKLLQFD